MMGTNRVGDSGPRRVAARRRGFTILELLISLALIAAMSAMVGVAVVERLREGTRDETLRQIRGALALVREDARRLGEPVRLVAERDGDGSTRLVARAWDLADEALRETDGDARAIGEIDVSRIAFDERGGGSADGLADREGAGRVYLTLARGYRIERLSEEELERERSVLVDGSGSSGEFGSGFAGEFGGSLAGGIAGGSARDETVTIGLFLPDGSVVVGSTPFVRTAEGELLAIEINPWTGSAALRALGDHEEAVGDGSDEERDADEVRDAGDERDDDEERGDGVDVTEALDGGRAGSVDGRDGGGERGGMDESDAIQDEDALGGGGL